QVAYYPVYQKIFIEVLDDDNQEEKKLKEYLLNTLNYGWGTHVIRDKRNIIDILNLQDKHIEIDQFIKQYEKIILSESVNNLYEFRHYHCWGNILWNIKYKSGGMNCEK
ncbi:MAG: hypothetical protein ACRC30_11600, partial [Clostridium sp.]